MNGDTPVIPIELEAYNEGLERARQIISRFIGKSMMKPNREGYPFIDMLNEIDTELMNEINKE